MEWGVWGDSKENWGLGGMGGEMGAGGMGIGEILPFAFLCQSWYEEPGHELITLLGTLLSARRARLGAGYKYMGLDRRPCFINLKAKLYVLFIL